MKNLLSFICMPWFLFACSQGFDRGRIEQGFASKPLQINNDKVADAKALHSQLKFPFKMAVAFVPSTKMNDWRWSMSDKDKFEKARTDLITAGVISDAFIMSDMFIDGWSIEDLRAAAAKHGADAVLVIRGDADIDRYVNPSSILYLTIVGLYIVPGTHRDALFVMQGGLIDVNNGYLYASAQSEGEYRTLRPYSYASDKDAIEPAKEKALTDFVNEITQRIRNLR